MLIGSMKNGTHNDNELFTFHPIGLAADRVFNSLRKSREFAVDPDSSSTKGSSSQTRSTKGPERSSFPPITNGGVPFAVGEKVDAFSSGNPAGAAIGGVLPIARLTKIDEPIVELVPIDVIDAAHRPDAGVMRPRDPVGEIQNVINADHAVAALMDGTGDGAAHLAIASPDQNAGSGIIVERSADLLGSQGELRFHDAFLKLEEEHRGEGADDRDEQQRRKGDEEAERKYVEYRLRQLAQFEARARGGRRP